MKMQELASHILQSEPSNSHRSNAPKHTCRITRNARTHCTTPPSHNQVTNATTRPLLPPPPKPPPPMHAPDLGRLRRRHPASSSIGRRPQPRHPLLLPPVPWCGTPKPRLPRRTLAQQESGKVTLQRGSLQPDLWLASSSSPKIWTGVLVHSISRPASMVADRSSEAARASYR